MFTSRQRSKRRDCMRKINTLLNVSLVICLSLSVSSCTIVKILARGNQPLILNTPPEHYRVLGHFKQSKGIAFDYTGAPDISAMVREGSAGYPESDAIVNTFITVEESVGDFFFDFFTLGLAHAYTITVEGDVIKYDR